MNSEYFLSEYDALKLGLHSIRKHISVIPQTPFLLKGTVRENLDPFTQIPVEELWVALEESGLSDLIKSVFLSLFSGLRASILISPTALICFQLGKSSFYVLLEPF